MTQWLELNDDQRRDTLTQAEVHSGIITKALEKDWWVTLTLKALFWTPFADRMAFKGGTSLSKCFALIERFSEDIDIALDPLAFGMPYQERPSNTFLKELKREGSLFTRTTLRDALLAELTELGLPQGTVTLEEEPVSENRPDADPQILHVRYISLYDPNPYIADEVKIEVSVRSILAPFTIRPIRSLLTEHFPRSAYPEDMFHIPVVEPRKTLLEKAFLLHEEFSKPLDRIKTERLTRHLYDLHRNRSASAMKEALEDHALYDHLVQHRQRYNRITGIDYNRHHHSTLSFLPPAELLPPLQDDYADMRTHMIYGDAPPFEKLLMELEELLKRFRLKQ